MTNFSSLRKIPVNNYVEREEFAGNIKIPLGPIIYRAYSWAVRCLAFCHLYPNYFVFAVLALEDAALPLLRKKNWWTPQEYQTQIMLMQQYQLDPTLAVLHPAVRQARAKFRRLCLILEPYLDPTSMIEYDLGGTPGALEGGTLDEGAAATWDMKNPTWDGPP